MPLSFDLKNIKQASIIIYLSILFVGLEASVQYDIFMKSFPLGIKSK